MRGLVLGFDAALGTGLLRGDDGKRYVFAIDDWLARPRPRPGQLVDFELHKGMALEIFVIKNAGIMDALPVGEAASTLSRHVARLSRKYAFSAKLLMPLGLLVLFAMPFLAQEGREFSGYNTIGYVRGLLDSTGTLSAIGSAETREVLEAGRSALYLYLLVYILPLMAAYQLLRGVQGHKGAERLFVLSAATLGMLALLPVLMVGWFHLLAPAGNASLKRSALANISLDLPGAYLNYSWGAVIMLGLAVLGLMNSLRRRGRRKRRPAAASATSVAAQQVVRPPADAAAQPAPHQPHQPQQPAREHPARRPRPRGPAQEPQPQQMAPATPPASPPQAPRAQQATVGQPGEQDVLFDERGHDERDDITELLRRIRQEEGEA